MEGQRPGKREGGSNDLLGVTHQKKMRKRDQNPEGCEEEALNDYKEMQNELKLVLCESRRKLLEFPSKHSPPEMRDGIEYLANRFQSLKPDVLVDPIYIGLFGSTGAGKSTLLNTIIDKNFFLPVSGSKSCTSCVVQVNTSRGKQHEAKIHLLTDEEWREELKRLVALADPEGDEDDDERQEAVLKISAVYGEEAEKKSYEELCRMKPIVRIPNSRCIVLRETNEQDLSEKMAPYIWIQSIRSSAKAGASKDDKISQLWPLIKNVEVTVPRLQVVPEGVVFMDIPGTGDFNSKRDAMWKEKINKCSVIWVVSSIERVLGTKILETLLKKGVEAFQCGMCRDISLVVTKSEQLDLREYKWEAKMENITKHDAILQRNTTVKEETRQMMMDKLKKKLPSNSEVLHKADLVYTVSAWEYWNGETLNKEETEIPKLREYIRNFSKVQKRNVLMDCVEEALVLFKVIQNLQSEKSSAPVPPPPLPVNKSYLKTLVEQKVFALEEDIETCFQAVRQPLSEGVDEAKKMYKSIIRKNLYQNHGYRGFHRTLKAVCMNKGVYVSRVFGRIDINESLAQPIYEKIDMSFGNVFRIQMGACSTLKACLDAFKKAVQQLLTETMTEYTVPDGESKLRFLQQETDFIIGETEKLILQKKADIYHSLIVSIQNDLLPYYEEGARQRGAMACDKMQTILSEGIKKESEMRMFEKAEENMRTHLENLKVDIIKRIKKDFSSMLSLAFCPQEQLNRMLLDLQSELLSIQAIHEKLHSARDT